ncbi:Alpha-tocopherol transfer protein-like, partial [Orchesella cincta]
ADNEDIVKSGIDINDAFLLGFLIGRKYNLTTAYETIQKYVDVRKRKYVHIFSTFLPESFLYLYDQPKFMAVLKHREKNTGCIVGIIRPSRDQKAMRRPFEDVLGVCALASDQLLYMEDAIENGGIMVISGEGCEFSHIKEVTPARLKTAIDIFYQAYPISVKQIHIVQCSLIFNTVIVIHRTLETFHEIFDPSVLPSWLGGNRLEEQDWEVLDNYFERVFLDKADYYDKLAQ